MAHIILSLLFMVLLIVASASIIHDLTRPLARAADYYAVAGHAARPVASIAVTGDSAEPAPLVAGPRGWRPRSVPVTRAAPRHRPIIAAAA